MDVEKVLGRLEELAVTYGLNIVFALLTFFIGWWIVKLVSGSIRKMLLKRGTDAAVVQFASRMLYALLLLFVIIAAMGRLGIQTASLVAMLGAGAFAIGLALQGSLSNFAAGVLIIVLKPFKIGDYIEGGGTSGTVEDVGMFMTTLKTPDNRKVVCPNTQMMSGTITNYSSRELRRLDLEVGVSYDDNIHTVDALLRQLLDSHELVLKEPAYTVGIKEFADSSINFVVRPWVKTVDYWTLYYELHKKVKDLFDENGITIPYPQQDVHLHQVVSS
ncbi:MAG: mechanosensitive ion channel family protein [Spirochaetota bacterium]